MRRCRDDNLKNLVAISREGGTTLILDEVSLNLLWPLQHSFWEPLCERDAD